MISSSVSFSFSIHTDSNLDPESLSMVNHSFFMSHGPSSRMGGREKVTSGDTNRTCKNRIKRRWFLEGAVRDSWAEYIDFSHLEKGLLAPDRAV